MSYRLVPELNRDECTVHNNFTDFDGHVGYLILVIIFSEKIKASIGRRLGAMVSSVYCRFVT